MCLPLMQLDSFLCKMSKKADSSKMCDHMTNFFYGSLETEGGTTSPVAQITPLSDILVKETKAADLLFRVFKAKLKLPCTHSVFR